MPITRWICRGCSNREVPLDHFETTRCGETVCHPDIAAVIIADRALQPESVVRVSHGLSCVRRAGIERAEEFAVDPLTLLAPLTGTAMHLLIKTLVGSDATHEVPVSGVIDGVKVHGTLDRARNGLIEDWKNKDTLRYLKDAEPEHMLQESIYAHLEGAGKVRGIVWYKSHKQLVPKPVSLLPIAEVIAARPFGGAHTVGELYHQADDLMAGRRTWQDLPLSGQSMRFGGDGPQLCDYCSVRETCTVAAFGKPF